MYFKGRVCWKGNTEYSSDNLYVTNRISKFYKIFMIPI